MSAVLKPVPETVAPAKASSMRDSAGKEILFSLGALALAAILVQAVYALWIRPHAEAILAENTQVTADGKRPILHLRSPYIILKDYEQETAIILTIWSLAMLAIQGRLVGQSRKLLDKQYIDVGESRVVMPEDARAYGRPIEQLPGEEQSMLLPRTLLMALNRFSATRSVQDTAEAVRDECELELSRLDAQLSMVRFTAWAIPAIGFVGTVRGIGVALQESQRAIQGDISGVTLGLGVTFNATLVALTLCIIVMFCLHQLQQAQDRLVLDTRMAVDRNLIRHMRVR